jgi:hypothetical protein
MPECDLRPIGLATKFYLGSPVLTNASLVSQIQTDPFSAID